MEKLPVYIMNKSMPEDKTGVFLAVVTGIMWVMVIMVMGG